MFDRIAFKAQARAQIKGNIAMLFVCWLIVAVLGGVAGMTYIGALLVPPPLAVGMALIYLDLHRGEPVKVERLFDGFRRFLPSILLYIMIGIFTALWTLLFIVPGIIKGISYSMAFYIMAERPELTAREALNESKRITYGHKMDLFVMGLSFIPWYLLCMVTFGLAGIYVTPYYTMAMTNAYKAISGGVDGRVEDVRAEGEN